MRHVVKTFVSTEVPNKKTHRIFTLFNLSVGPHLSISWIDQILIRPSSVGIADNDISRNGFAASKRYAIGATTVDIDAANFSASAQSATHVFNQSD